MKKFLLSLSALAAFVILSSTSLPDELNCFDKWQKKFEERGANEVTDGWHLDVVATFRKGGNADCYPAKVEVKEGKITQIHLKYEDGTYEIFKKSFKPVGEFTIVNGISQTRITTDEELVNIIFVKHLKPPKKKLVSAPDPDDL